MHLWRREVTEGQPARPHAGDRGEEGKLRPAARAGKAAIDPSRTTGSLASTSPRPKKTARSKVLESYSAGRRADTAAV